MKAEVFLLEWIKENQIEYENFPVPELMKAYHKHRVNEITDEDIEKEMYIQSEDLHDGYNDDRVREMTELSIERVKWFKNKLLK